MDEEAREKFEKKKAAANVDGFSEDAGENDEADEVSEENFPEASAPSDVKNIATPKARGRRVDVLDTDQFQGNSNLDDASVNVVEGTGDEKATTAANVFVQWIKGEVAKYKEFEINPTCIQWGVSQGNQVNAVLGSVAARIARIVD